MTTGFSPRIELALAIACFSVATSLPAASAAQVSGKLLPVDESAGDSGFRAFRATLERIIVKRDLSSLVARAAADIHLGPDWDRDPESFRALWRVENGEDDRLWKRLAVALRLGLTREDGGYCGPYTVTRYPPGALDGAAVAAARNLPLRAAPASSSPLVARLSHDLITVEEGEAPVREAAGESAIVWRHVRTNQGLAGYVEQRHVEMARDWKVCFRREDGQWRITKLLPGASER